MEDLRVWDFSRIVAREDWSDGCSGYESVEVDWAVVGLVVLAESAFFSLCSIWSRRLSIEAPDAKDWWSCEVLICSELKLIMVSPVKKLD